MRRRSEREEAGQSAGRCLRLRVHRMGSLEAPGILDEFLDVSEPHFVTLASESFPIPSAWDPAPLGPLLRCLPYLVVLLSCPVLWKGIFTISSLHVDKGCDLLKVTEQCFLAAAS